MWDCQCHAHQKASSMQWALTVVTAECSPCQQQKPVLRQQNGNNLGGDKNQTVRCKSNTLDPFLIYKGNHLVPFSRALQNCLVHRHGIPQTIASNKGTHFTVKELWEWAHAHEANWSCQVLHFPETASFLEHYNSLLRAQQEFPSEGKSLQGLGAMLQDAMY